MSLSSSPFPPIADDAFLSNCHTGALVAPDGSVDWLCVPSFDSPSAEEFEVDRARHLGNFPQAFSHLALIEAAGRIILTERRDELPV